jgi:hypothetical protein
MVLSDMASMRLIEDVYAYHGGLPLGCMYCVQGVKIVIFITGLCGDKCFYCPVSSQRLYKDVMYVDEEPLETIDDVIEEAYNIGAEGASITGGDPLLRLKRTIKVIKALKEVFGEDFHIHLYTSGRFLTVDVLVELERTGLDELRIHPTTQELWSRVELAVKHSRSLDVGVEVPVFPDKVEELWKMMLWLDRIGVKFINLNEAEVSEHNVEQIMSRNYSMAKGRPVIKGSEEAAIELVKRATRHGLKMKVHYCPARFKDYVQMRLRLIRKAMRLAKYYENVTRDGMLEYFEVLHGVEDKVLADIGEATGGKLLLPTRLAREMGLMGRIVRRYPSLRGRGLPIEIESVSKKSYDAA